MGDIFCFGWYLLPVGGGAENGVGVEGGLFLAKILHPYSLLLFSEGIYIQG